MTLFIATFIEVLFLSLINGLGFTGIFSSIAFIIINIYFLYIDLVEKNKKYLLAFLLGYSVRVVVLFLDLYARNYINVFSSGADTEAFFRIAMEVSNNYSLLFATLRGGLYTKSLGILINFIGPNRLFLQYINIVLSMLTAIIVLRIMEKLIISEKIRFLGTCLFLFFPVTVIHSSILLRESLITYLLTLSLYYYIKWFNKNNITYFILSILLIIPACVLHAGVIGIFIMYVLSYLKKSAFNNKINFTKFISSFIVLTVLLLIFNKRDIFFNRIAFSNSEDLYNNINAPIMYTGGSTYLKNLYISSPLQLITYSPIKIVYFLISPVIFDWKGIGDIVAFFMDSSFYIISLFCIIKYLKKYKDKNDIVIHLILAVFITSLIFAFGVSNSGTAMRHRNKIFILFLLIDLCYLEKNIKRGVKL